MAIRISLILPIQFSAISLSINISPSSLLDFACSIISLAFWRWDNILSASRLFIFFNANTSQSANKMSFLLLIIETYLLEDCLRKFRYLSVGVDSLTVSPTSGCFFESPYFIWLFGCSFWISDIHMPPWWEFGFLRAKYVRLAPLTHWKYVRLYVTRFFLNKKRRRKFCTFNLS